MPLELRPAWCLTDEAVDEVMTFGPWTDHEGVPAYGRDGDDWRPGDILRLHRTVKLGVDPVDLRRRLGLRAGAVVGVAARWSCRSTSTAGVHSDGPTPLGLTPDTHLMIDVPASIAGSLEIETCLVVNWTTPERPTASCPEGALIWSDGWSVPARDRTILLEGAQARIPVRTVSFDQHFGQPSGALWAIDLDPSIGPDDLTANVATVLLNKDILQREFRGVADEPDAALLPPSALAGISVDLVRVLTAALSEELDGSEDWTELADGSVGAMLLLRLTEAFGSVARALEVFESDQPTFSRELWNRFAPDSWRAR